MAINNSGPPWAERSRRDREIYGPSSMGPERAIKYKSGGIQIPMGPGPTSSQAEVGEQTELLLRGDRGEWEW